MRILNLEPNNFSLKAKQILKTVAKYKDVKNLNFVKKCQKTNIIITRLGHNIDSKFLENFPNLIAIATATTGLNHINLNKISAKKITVLSLKDETKFLSSITATAEHHWALLLSLIRKVPKANESVKNYNWEREKFTGFQLKNKIIGIVGYGRIGKMIAKFSKSFGMQIIAHEKKKLKNKKMIRFVNLEELFRTSDIISINLSLTSDTEKIISKELLFSTKNNVYIINTSRGELIDEEALVEKIKKGKIGGFATDVLSNELSKTSDFFKKNKLVELSNKNKNIIITPHIGGACTDAMRETEVFIAKKIVKFIKGFKKND